MADTAAAINLANGLKADRKLEMIFVNMGTGETEEWELLGRGVEDASVAFNHDTNQTTDILGITDTEVSPAKPELDLDPCTIRGGQKLSAKLLDIERRNAIAELGQFTILHVHCFLGTASAFTAEKHTNCTIVPQSLGGSTYVGMPMNVYLSNEKVLGTATVANGVPTFTPTTAAEQEGCAMATLKIDLGLKSFEVCDTDGNTLGTIRFNPSDPGLLPRWKDAEKRVRELASTPEGEYDTADGLAMLDREVKAQIDHAFGTPVSEVFFQQVSSLAICEDGSMVLDHVLQAVEPIILEAQKTAQANSEARIKAHTGKYEGKAIGLAPEQR